MALRTASIERFGGLNLVEDPSELGPAGAVDLLNVWPTRGGAQTCPTVSTFATATDPVLRLFAFGNQLLASEDDGTNITLEAFSNGGTSIAATSYTGTLHQIPHSFASVGTDSASAVYAVRSLDTTRKWDGSAWSTVASVPTAALAAPADNRTRLAVANLTGFTSRVAFSDAGDPETFGADNTVDIAPGDGESIQDLVYWNGLLFAFKQTKFVVFTNVATDRDGEPIFDYRMVDTGIGAGGINAAGAACAGPDGVYFLADSGIYRTRGDQPQLVSRPISPLWPRADPAPYTSVPRISLTAISNLSAIGDTLYATVQSDAGRKMTLVRVGEEWTYLDIQANGTNQRSANVIGAFRDYILFSTPASTTIKRLNPGAGPGSLTWSYTSGFYDLGSPGEKLIRASALYGTGSVNVQLLAEGARPTDVADPGATLTLGTAPDLARARRSRSVRGRLFAHKLSGTGPATVSRLDHLYQPPATST